MSRVKVNSITPFTGQNINFGGHAIPSGSSKNLGSETQAWAELYVSTGSVNFVAPIVLGQPTVVVATLRAGGEGLTTGIATGQIFTETNNNLRGSFSVGRNNRASGTASLANGIYHTASGDYSHAEGWGTRATGLASHTEGFATIASNDYSHAEGYFTTATGQYSHAEGSDTRALGVTSHAEGNQTLASGSTSHAEGYLTTASGLGSHAEGHSTIASGAYSHAEGYLTTALGNWSHAEGVGTIANSNYQMAIGRYNTAGNVNSLFVIGIGTSTSSRADAFSIDADNSGRVHMVVPTNTSNPNNFKTGSMYFNPSTNLMFIYNGTAWRSSSFA